MSMVAGPTAACNTGGGASTYSGGYAGRGAYGGGGTYAGTGGGVCGEACGPACGEACGGGFDRYQEVGFVGGGGDYAPATYRYVGRGAGQYGLQESRIPRPCNWCLICLIPLSILLLLTLLPLLYYLLQPGTVTTTLPPPPPTTSLPYDCDMGTPEFWSGGKKTYCCEKLGNPAGCQEPVAIGSGDGPVAIGSS
mmetsp:Transcript_124255/g.351784  ORF Transcript_124255/g.351784 Transcript_124255/m.351784 type:complete len:194 (+) Transcript_124255:88-669(+)